jgi:Tol biopolymer transport system component
LRGWETPENAAWEEEHKSFRFNDDWRLDIFLYEMKTGKLTNLTAVERVSGYNSGLFFWPQKPNALGFQALIGGNSHPFRMDRDGRNKRDLTAESKEFAYGFSVSPEGERIAYHKSYQVHIADADGSNVKRVETGQPFNFAPTWSPNGEWILFLSGEHYNCHPHIVRRDGTGLRKLADRNGYIGVVEFLDVPDYHGGSSDTPAWMPDGERILFTSKVGDSVELMRVSLKGRVERLTQTPPGAGRYHPQASRDGKWIVLGSRLGGLRRLEILPSQGGEPFPITEPKAGWGAMWAHWQPLR